MPRTLPVLYSFRRCPYAMRARLALHACGIAVEHREVVLRNKPAHMLALSPKGSVPVMWLPDSPGATGGQVLEQSLDIMLWALRQQDPHSWLPASEAGLADALALIAHTTGPSNNNWTATNTPTDLAWTAARPTAMRRRFGCTRWMHGFAHSFFWLAIASAWPMRLWPLLCGNSPTPTPPGLHHSLGPPWPPGWPHSKALRCLRPSCTSTRPGQNRQLFCSAHPVGDGRGTRP